MRSFEVGLSNPVARSGDLRGGGGVFGQVLTMATTLDLVVPAGAPFLFAELLGPGGTTATNGSWIGGGGAGQDAILPVVPGETLQFSGSVSNRTLLKRGTTILLQANPGNSSGTYAGAASTGKYPGAAGGSAQLSGIGGGRLAGTEGGNNRSLPGKGASPGGTAGVWGAHVGCFTFFATYDDALAFAKSVYGGTWTP